MELTEIARDLRILKNLDGLREGLPNIAMTGPRVAFNRDGGDEANKYIIDKFINRIGFNHIIAYGYKGNMHFETSIIVNGKYRFFNFYADNYSTSEIIKCLHSMAEEIKGYNSKILSGEKYFEIMNDIIEIEKFTDKGYLNI